MSARPGWRLTAERNRRDQRSVAGRAFGRPAGARPFSCDAKTRSVALLARDRAEQRDEINRQRAGRALAAANL
jgi:hypothetical protein